MDYISTDHIAFIFYLFFIYYFLEFEPPQCSNLLQSCIHYLSFYQSSDSGSESESGIRTQKSARPKSVDGSDNNTGSNNEDDNGSIGLNIRDGSDHGSGTQV